MSKTYLVDYENTGMNGLVGCDKLQSVDRIILFFTKNNSKIDMSVIANHGEADFKMIEVSSGKQSADLHIGSYLGYLLAEKKSGGHEFVIVSKDSDFDNLLKFWKVKTNVKLKRAPAIGQSANNDTAESKDCSQKDAANKTEINNQVMKAFSNAGFSPDIVGYAASLVAKNIGEKNAKQQIYRTIISRYGQKQGLEIYRIIKKTIK